MQFLIDKVASEVERKQQLHPEFVRGQLLTPLTGYSDWGKEYAIDNGAFSRFPKDRWCRLLWRQRSYGDESLARCLFVTCPDVVASARRTLEIWKYRELFLDRMPEYGPKLALVAQDGLEDLDIPWSEFSWLFVGGGDPWKDSRSSRDIVKTAKILGKFVHVGRVNTKRRFELFADLDCDTCDGSGVAMYDHMLNDIAAVDNRPTLFGENDAG